MADRGKNNKASKDPYKGVRDFYPQDKFVQNYIFDTWRKTAKSFGYSEYDASILEPAELYRDKSSQEIVDKQTYSFTDRGGREVTLRPEMTPTLARMVAKKKKTLAFPLRWFSIPNVFRYEKPQKGRLREHWQLNVDAFGLEGADIEIEIISLAHTVMRNLGLPEETFEIKVSSRESLSKALKEKYNLKKEEQKEFMRLLDKKDKIDDFDKKSEEILGEPFDPKAVKDDRVEEVINRLFDLGITNVIFDPAVVRGFDYYTGLVFEIFDTSPDNNRSLFGGGRYDNLLEIFGEEPIPAFGFGMGDVTIRDTLENYELLPEYKTPAEVYLCAVNKKFIPITQKLAQTLRFEDLPTETDLTGDKISNQIKRADKNGASFVICVGEEEIKNNLYKIKHLESGKEIEAESGLIAKTINEFKVENNSQ